MQSTIKWNAFAIAWSLCAFQALAQSPASTPTPATQPSIPIPAVLANWKFEGDIRVRYEGTTDQEPTGTPGALDTRHRAVARFRAGATKPFGQIFRAGVRVATGSADDPNSTDITIGDFDDKLELNLDRVFIEMRHGRTVATAGKFANPFASTELVWDGDVPPQGFAASWTSGSPASRSKARLVGMFFVVDEQTVASDSSMAGVQAQWIAKPSSAKWSATIAGAFWDYTIESLRNADAGDTRSNRLRPDRTAYLSDFDLLDATFTVDHRGFGDRFPVRVVGDVVKNLGADDENMGMGLDVFVGRASAKGDMRFRYGYARAETDAVLAAFSHDNTTLATNYKQHTLTWDYQLSSDVQLNATCYVYNRLEGSGSNPWTTRLRLNLLVTF